MKKLAVIILNWNGVSLLKRFVPIASRFTCGEADLFVADNGSSDGSLQWLRKNHPGVGIIKLGSNLGFAEGYNRAIDLLPGVAGHDYPYTLLLNSDVEVTPGWWQPLVDFMESNPQAGAAQPKIKSLADKGSFEYAGAAGGYLDRLGYPYCRGRLFDCVEKDRGQYDTPPEEVCWASGAAMIVRTDLYRRLGGLDGKFFAHMEEIDLCCRIHAAGFKVYALSESEVYHMGGASLSQGNPRKTYLNFRNNLLLLHKNMPRREGKRLLFLRRLADTAAFAMYLLKFDWGNAAAVVRAHNDFRRMRRSYTVRAAANFLPTLPGARRFALIDRFLLRKKK